jgi:inhibitor of cysteine peptidase
MKTRIRPWILTLVIGFTLVACGASNPTYYETDSGKTLTLTPGDEISVKLEGNVTTGYTWAFAPDVSGVIEEVGEAAYESDSTLAGAGGEFTFTFRAAAPGTTKLTLHYLRPWEEEDPISTFTLEITVSE